jgi:hypothetical protein
MPVWHWHTGAANSYYGHAKRPLPGRGGESPRLLTGASVPRRAPTRIGAT